MRVDRPASSTQKLTRSTKMAQKENTVVPSEQSKVSKSNKKDIHVKISSSKAATKKSNVFSDVSATKRKGRLLRKRTVSDEKSKLEHLNKKHSSNVSSRSSQAEFNEERNTTKVVDDAPLRRSSRQAVRERRVWARSGRQSCASPSPEVARAGGAGKLPQAGRKKRGRPPNVRADQPSPAASGGSDGPLGKHAEPASEVQGRRSGDGGVMPVRRISCRCPVKSKIRGRCRKCSRNQSQGVNGEVNRIGSSTRAQKPVLRHSQCKSKTVKSDSISEEDVQADVEQGSEDEDIEEHSEESPEIISNGESILESLGVCKNSDLSSMRDVPLRDGGQLNVLETSRIIRESLKAPSFLTNSFAPINCVSNSNKGLSGLARSKLCPGSSMVPCSSNQSKFRNSIANRLIVSSYYKKKRSSLMPNRMKNVLNMMRERPPASSKSKAAQSAAPPEPGRLPPSRGLPGSSADISAAAPAAAYDWSKPKGLSSREKERRADAASSLIQKLRLHSSKINMSSTRKSYPVKNNSLSIAENSSSKSSSADTTEQVEVTAASTDEVKSEILKPVHEPVIRVPSGKAADFPGKQEKQEAKLCDESVGFSSPVCFIPELPISSTISKLQARVQNHGTPVSSILQQSLEMKSPDSDHDNKSSLVESDSSIPDKISPSSVTATMSPPKLEDVCSSNSTSLIVNSSHQKKEFKDSFIRTVDVQDKVSLPRCETSDTVVQSFADRTLLSTNQEDNDTPMSPLSEGRVPLMAALAQLVQASDTQETESQILTIHSADNLMQVPIKSSEHCQPDPAPVQMVGLDKSFVSLASSDANVIELKFPVQKEKDGKSTSTGAKDVPRDERASAVHASEKVFSSPTQLQPSSHPVLLEKRDAPDDLSSAPTSEACDTAALRRAATVKPGQRSLGIKTPLKCPECPMQFCTVRSLLWHFGSHASSAACAQPPPLLQHLRAPWPPAADAPTPAADLLSLGSAMEALEAPHTLFKSVQVSASSANPSGSHTISLPSNVFEVQHNDEKLSSDMQSSEAKQASKSHNEKHGPCSQTSSRFHDKPKLTENLSSSCIPGNDAGTVNNVSIPKVRSITSCKPRPVFSAARDETGTTSVAETTKRKSKVKVPAVRRGRPKKLKDIDSLTVKHGRVISHNTPLAATSSGIVATIVGNHMIESTLSTAEIESLPRETYDAFLQSKSHGKDLLKIPQPRLKSTSFSCSESGKLKPRFVNILPKASINSDSSMSSNCDAGVSGPASSSARKESSQQFSANRSYLTGQRGKMKPQPDVVASSSLNSPVHQRTSEIYKKTLDKSPFMGKSDHEDEDTVVMINPNLGLRMISKADASSFGKTSPASNFGGQNYAGFSFGGSSFLSNPPNSLTIVPQVGESVSKTRNSSPPSPDILTIVPQMSSSKQITTSSPKSQASILTAAGTLSPTCGVKLVLAQPSSEQRSFASRAQDTSFGSRGDVDSDEEIMVIDEKPEDDQKVDPISMCTVAIDEEASTSLTGNTSAGDKSSSSLENEIVDVTSIDDSCEVRDLLLSSSARENAKKLHFTSHSLVKTPVPVVKKSPDVDSASCFKSPLDTLVVSSSDLLTRSGYSCSTYASSSLVPSISVYKASTPFSAISHPVPSALKSPVSSVLSPISSLYPSSVLPSPQSSCAFSSSGLPQFTLDAAAPTLSQHSAAVSPAARHSIPLTTTPVVTPTFAAHRMLSVTPQAISVSQSPLILPSVSVISTCTSPLVSTMSLPSLLPLSFPSQPNIAMSPLSSPFSPSLALASVASNSTIPVSIPSFTPVSVPTFTPVSLPLPAVSVAPRSIQPLSHMTVTPRTSLVPSIADAQGKSCQISGCLSQNSGIASSFSSLKSCNNSFPTVKIASSANAETSWSTVPPLTPISPKIQPAVCFGNRPVSLLENASQSCVTIAESNAPMISSTSSVCDVATVKVCSSNGGRDKITSRAKSLTGRRATRLTSRSRFSSRNSKLRKHCCPYCDKRFGWSTDLKRHIIIHTGERPFKCDSCLNSFTRKFLLENHVNRVHAS